MGELRNLLNRANTSDKLAAGEKFAQSEFKKLGLTITAKAADLPKVVKLMDKTKPATPADFFLGFDGKLIRFYIQVGSTVEVLASLELAKAGSPGVQRAILVKLKDIFAIAEQATLDAFNKKHPPPPTAQEQQALQQAISPLRTQLRDKNAKLDALKAEIKKLEEQLKPLVEKETDFKKRWDAD
jgi:predicted nuclease with TOPRIM domain